MKPFSSILFISAIVIKLTFAKDNLRRSSTVFEAGDPKTITLKLVDDENDYHRHWDISRRWCLFQFGGGRSKFLEGYSKASSEIWSKYAQYHNATYQLVNEKHSKEMTGRWGPWNKWVSISDHYDDCDTITVLDFDTVIKEPSIHILEYIEKNYGFTRNSGFFAAPDPETPKNFNYISGEINLNTGFVTFNVNDRTKMLLRDMWECPLIIKGCVFTKWGRPSIKSIHKNNFNQNARAFSDQGAFNIMRHIYESSSPTRINEEDSYDAVLESLIEGDNVKAQKVIKEGFKNPSGDMYHDVKERYAELSRKKDDDMFVVGETSKFNGGHGKIVAHAWSNKDRIITLAEEPLSWLNKQLTISIEMAEK